MEHGLDTEALAIAAACIVLWSVFSARLEGWYISAPIAFVVMGLVVTHGPLVLVHFSPHSETVKSLAEVTLALVLFTDASRVNLHELRADLGLPVRLLAIGLPLTIGFGTAAAFGIIPGVSLWVAATIGAIVAPTDAALGATIMEDTRIPNRIRRLLNVESGLNDGIATPFVNLFLAGAVTTEVAHSTTVVSAAGELLVGAGGGCRRRARRGMGAGPGQRSGLERSGLPDARRPGPGPLRLRHRHPSPRQRVRRRVHCRHVVRLRGPRRPRAHGRFRRGVGFTAVTDGVADLRRCDGGPRFRARHMERLRLRRPGPHRRADGPGCPGPGGNRISTDSPSASSDGSGRGGSPRSCSA